MLISNKSVYIDGKPLVEPYTQFIEAHYGKDNKTASPEYGPVIVPQDHLFVLGDNRDISWDSRYWGFVPIKNVFGKPLVTFWSYDHETHNIRFKELFKIIR